MPGLIARTAEEIRRDVAAARSRDPAARGVGSFEIVATWPGVHALLAHRIAELAGADGPFAPGDVAVLVRASTDIALYERAIADQGLPTYVAGGGGYWSQQQVGDLRAYLAALANPRDELALYSLLASPLVGVSLDALALIGDDHPSERATVLVDQHGTRRQLDRTVVYGPPEREVAAPYDDEVDVGDLGERNERGMIESPGVAHRRSRLVTERDPERGSGFGENVVKAGRSRREQGQVPPHVHDEAVERLAGRMRTGP